MIGTTIEMIEREEETLERSLPNSFKDWLLKNNGKGINDVTIFPIKDDNNIKKTWASISYEKENWEAELEAFDDVNFSNLLPFGTNGAGNYYCFDYSESQNTEQKIVCWSHETGETEFRARDFNEFVQKADSGDFDFD